MQCQSVTVKLSKQFLFGPPEGVFLVSNFMDAPGQPILAQTVRPIPQRLTQWQAIVDAGVSHRLCHVFKHPADHLALSLEIP